jgi:uncharacterized protein CbrC (UPF0167 family)
VGEDSPVALPQFTYHPDPLGTGSIEQSPDICEACDQARGYVYTGPVFAVDEIETVCPWCIADGSFAEEFDAEFTDLDGAPADVPRAVLLEVGKRTPGFAGWQQEHWMYHCSDAAMFLGRAGWAELEGLPDAVESLRAELPNEEALRWLHKDGDATAYLFKCRHCGTHLAYWDAS